MKEKKLQVEYKSVDLLIPYVNNARTHSDSQILQISASIKEFGFNSPILLDGDNGIIAGHGRLMGAKKLGMKEVPCVELSHLTETQKKAYILADNKLALNAGWDDALLANELEALKALDFDLSLAGFDEDELKSLTAGGENEELTAKNCSGNLSGKFMIPPFSVLNAREGWWQDRKRAWLAIGIKSEVGRDAATGGSKMVARYVDGKRQTGLIVESDTSVFDPVLCEVAYRWFSPVNGLVLDPFAGGSVRGIVAAKLGRKYIGHELRKEQVEANREQAANIISESGAASWVIGDSRNIHNTCKDVQADFIFSCPPYADLEVYSDNPEDLSTLDYAEFKKAYFEIIAKTCGLLKHDRFACFVVGEVRDKKGNYYNFVGDTIEAFRTAGLEFYNEAILVTAIGSLPLRAGKTFSASRKIGKTHQNILVFVKGDGKKAADACGVVEVDESMFEGIESAD